MKTIVVANRKGGCGMTILVGCPAAALAEQWMNTLSIDPTEGELLPGTPPSKRKKVLLAV